MTVTNVYRNVPNVGYRQILVVILYYPVLCCTVTLFWEENMQKISVGFWIGAIVAASISAVAIKATAQEQAVKIGIMELGKTYQVYNLRASPIITVEEILDDCWMRVSSQDESIPAYWNACALLALDIATEPAPEQ
jgi:hypothetical protein